MIKINLLKEEKKGRGISLPSLREFSLSKENLIQEGAVKVLLAVSAALVVAELGYLFSLRKTASNLESQKNQLVQERDRWKAKAQRFLVERKRLENEIRAVKDRIDYLVRSKEVILVMKKYYRPFNSSLKYVYTKTPPTVWLYSFSQNQDFGSISMSMSFSAYDINTIDEFFSILDKEYSTPIIQSIQRKLNPYGIEYYVSNIKSSKVITSESLGN